MLSFLAFKLTGLTPIDTFVQWLGGNVASR